MLSEVKAYLRSSVKALVRPAMTPMMLGTSEAVTPELANTKPKQSEVVPALRISRNSS